MPRTISAPALAILLAQEHWHWLRVKIENPDGVLTNVSLLQGEDWLNAAVVSDDIDKATMGATVRLRLDTDATSFAPTMGGSPINRDALDAYKPFLRPYAEVEIAVAVTAVGVSPGDPDWHSLGRFSTDKVRYGHEERDVAELELRDIGARILDRQITRKKTYGDPDGALSLAEVIEEQILVDTFGDPPNANYNAPDPWVDDPKMDIVFRAPSEPEAIVFEWEVEPGSVGVAARDRALQIGHELKYRFDPADDEFVWMLHEPDRARPMVVDGPPFDPGDEPDWTLNADQYEKITQLDLGIEYVRNFIEVEYYDLDLDVRRRVRSVNLASIAKYGVRWMEIVEADDSLIDSIEEAQALADAAASDLSEPFAELELEMHLFWPVQLGDVFDIEANDVHFDSRQRLAVVAISHDLSEPGFGKTRLMLRGKVTGAYKEWFRKADDSDDDDVAEMGINNLREIGRTATEVTLGWDVTGAPYEQWLWLDTFEQPVTEDPWPTLDSPGMIRLTSDTREYTVGIPVNGFIKYGILIPVTAEGETGRPWPITVQPNDALPLLDGYRQTPGASGLFRDLSFYVKDPAGLGGTLKAWVNRSDSADANPDGAVEGTLAIASTSPPYVADSTRDFTLPGGGTSKLLDDIRVHPGKGKRIFFEFVSTNGISSGLQAVVLTPGTSPVDDTNNLIAGIINSLTPFASGVKPVELLTPPLPVPPGPGRVALNTADGKLYRSTADGLNWTAAIATVDLTGTINSAQIAADAIQAQHIADLAVETAALAVGAVNASILAANAVTETKIANDAVTTPKLIAGAVVTGKIAAGAVTANEIAANTIVAGNIAAGTITGGKIAANTITAGNITAGTITSVEIAANTIVAGNIAAGTITATQIAANTITAGQIAAGTITATQIAASTITATQIAANTITAGKLNISTLASIATDAGIIVAGKLQNAAGTQYLDLNASGTNGFLVHTKLILRANGNAEFSGDIVLSAGVSSLYWKDGATTRGEMFSFYVSGGPPGFTHAGFGTVVYGPTSGSASMYFYYHQEVDVGVLSVEGRIRASLAITTDSDIEAAGNIDAASYSAGGTPGITADVDVPAHITVVNGIVTNVYS